jgi:hypothetical protein
MTDHQLILACLVLFNCNTVESMVKKLLYFSELPCCSPYSLPKDQRCSHCGLALLSVCYYEHGQGHIYSDNYFCTFCNPGTDGIHCLSLETPVLYRMMADFIQYINPVYDNLTWIIVSSSPDEEALLQKNLFEDRLQSSSCNSATQV